MFYGFILKKSGNKYNDLDTKPSPFRMIALTTSPVFTKERNRGQGKLPVDSWDKPLERVITENGD